MRLRALTGLERNKLERFFDQNRHVLVEQGKKIKNKTMHAYYAFVLSQMKLNGKLSEASQKKVEHFRQMHIKYPDYAR